MNDKLECLKRTAIVLPSLDPDAKFRAVVEGLLKKGFEHIVIVNDGSAAENLRAAACKRKLLPRQTDGRRRKILYKTGIQQQPR